MKTRYILLFSFFTLLVGFVNSQDLIIKKDSTKIYCKIVSENPRTIFYYLSNPSTQLQINKTEVEKFVFDWRQNLNTGAVPSNTANSSREFVQVHINGGIAIPVAEFASKDVNSDQSGLAVTGFVLNGTAVIKLTKKFGISLGYLFQSNACDLTALDDELRHSNPAVSFSTTGTSWIVRGFFGGIHLAIPVNESKKTALFFDFQAGLPKYISPQIETVGTSRGTTASIRQEIAETSGFATIFGLGLLHKVNSDLSLKVATSVINGKGEFKDVPVHSSFNPLSYNSFTQKIITFNWQVGIVLNLD